MGSQHDCVLLALAVACAPGCSKQVNEAGREASGPTDGGSQEASANASICVAGHCLVAIAAGQESPCGIAVDAKNVYWTNAGSPNVPGLLTHLGDGSVMKAPLAGGPVTTLASSQMNPVFVAVDSENVYWTNSTFEDGGRIMRHAVLKAPLIGGAVTVLASDLPGLPNGLAAGVPGVYLANSNGLVRVPTDGGALATVARPPMGTTIGYNGTGDAGVLLAVPYPAAGSIDNVAVHGSDVYWTTEATHFFPDDAGTGGVTIPENTIQTLGPDGNALTVATSGPLSAGFSLNSTSAFWIDQSSLVPQSPGFIRRASLRGGDPGTVATGPWAPLAIAVDDTSAYGMAVAFPALGIGDVGFVMKVPADADGGEPTVLALTSPRSVDLCSSIAVDGTSVYWTDSDDGAVMRLTPK